MNTGKWDLERNGLGNGNGTPFRTLYKGKFRIVAPKIQLNGKKTVFEGLTKSLYEKKNAVYCFQMSFLYPEIFKFIKYTNCQSDDTDRLNRLLIKYEERDISTNLYLQMFDSLWFFFTI